MSKVELTELEVCKVGVTDFMIMKDYCVKQIEKLRRRIEELEKELKG